MKQIKFFASVLNPVFKDQVPSLKITFLYFVIGVLWILFSDKLLFNIIDDSQLLLYIQNIKGFLFVLITAVLLYFIINSSHEKIRKSTNHYRKVEDKLHHHVYYDSITNLPNRRSLIEHLNYALTSAKRTEQMVGVLIFDVDHKSINDSLGHVFGDTLLYEVAYRLREIISQEDVVFQFGTDEFAVIIQDMSDITETAKIGQDIIDLLSHPFKVMEHEIFITTSIGISLYPSDAEDTNTLIRYAEAALYRANQIGRNNYQFYTSEMSAVIIERLTMENSLRKAIESEEFIVYYQPQIDLRSGQIVGLEALIRWNHPTYGILSPANFISLAEETDLIIPIGEWVLRKACQQNKIWQEDGYNQFSVSVNLSPRQFEDPELVKKIERILTQTGLDPKWLHLEVTEGVIMKDIEEAIATMHKIKDLGVQISIDDFGTGYSSLGYLKKFPISTLKIDRSFLKDIPSDKTDASITAAIIKLAHSLGLIVIAEGVETQDQLSFLLENGCDHVQGFLISQPLPKEMILEVIKKVDISVSPMSYAISNKR